LPAGARLIALDEHGALWSSRALSERLMAWRDQGVAELASQSVVPTALGRQYSTARRKDYRSGR